MDKETLKIQIQSKNLGIGVILTLLFGGFGLFYASISGGIIMTILELISIVLCFVFIGFVLLPIVHVIAIIWTVVAIQNHNKKLLS
jgi:uncharacterized membrane protein